MNILILNWRDIQDPKAGGAELVTMEHAKYWIKKGHKVTWLTSRFPGSKESEVFDDIQFVRKGNAISIYLIAPFYYLINRKKFDVVIDEIHGIPFFTPLYSKKNIAFIHEVAGEIWDYMYPFPISKIGKFIENLYFKFYKNTLFWTDAASTVDELVQKGIPRKNCHAIPCPVDIVFAAQLPKKEENPTFIFVSRLVKMKGIESILEAFSYIKGELPKAQLWIVGGGEKKYLNYLKRIVSGNKIVESVTFYDFVSQTKKVELLSKAHILLHASVKEGWGLVILEAGSQMTPSVVYNVPGLRDSVKNNITGILVRENSPIQLGISAVSLYNDKKMYVQMQKNAYNWSKSLKWEDVAEESLALIIEVTLSQQGLKRK